MARLARRSMTASATLTITAGQCVPGTRCHVIPDGTLQACERASLCLPIGHVDTGFDEEKIEKLLMRFAELVQSHCRDCWAARLCRKCIADITEGSILSPDRLSAICIGRRREMERDIIDYCRARSQNDRCFSSLAAYRGNIDDPPDPETGIEAQDHIVADRNGQDVSPVYEAKGHR